MATGVGWDAERVLNLAPDAASAEAGRSLATPHRWDYLGRRGDLLWGECRGSGSRLYRCRVDLAGPSASCSCPSRKSPCKHALGLMFAQVDDPNALPDAEPPDWVAAWAEGRTRKAGARSEKAPVRPAAAEAARRKREAARESKVAAGLDDLDRWMGDLVRSGFATLASRPESIWSEQARRLIDAQCPGVARRVAQIATMPRAGEGRQAALLDRLGQLHLIAAGFRRRDRLPAPELADLRAAIGFPTDGEAVRLGSAGTHVRDVWHVLGQVFAVEDKIPMRRTSLRGAATHRPALVIDFAAPGRAFEAGLEPGTTVDLTLGFFPGAAPLRALVVEQHAPAVALDRLDGALTIAEAQAALGALLARAPWQDLIPVALAAITLRPAAEGWRAVDPSGAFVPLSPRFDRIWSVLARSGGAPITLLGELSGANLHPTGALIAGAFVPLADAREPTHAPSLAGAAGRWPTPETPLLRDLAASAVLGTDRRGLPALDPADPLAPLAAGILDREASVRLLALAGAAGLHARVGRRANLGPVPEPDLAPLDDRPPSSPGAAGLLARLLAEEFGPPSGQNDLFHAWLTACNQAGRRVPETLLASLLGAYQDLTLIPELTPVLGSRGRWLAGQNPKWHRYADADAPAPEAITTTWQSGTKAERLALLRDLRRADPDAARDLAATTFAADPANFRAEVLATFRVGLTMADEPMLEAALDDRGQEVRATAAAILADLPTSRLVERMTKRAWAILRWDGDRLAVLGPAEADAAMIRDGVAPEPRAIWNAGQQLRDVGQKGWLLVEVLSRVPPDRVVEHLARPPVAILDAARATSYDRELTHAWGAAAIRHRDPVWCRALLEAWLTHDPKLEFGRVPHLPGLLAGLEPADRDALILAHWSADPNLSRADRAPLALLHAVDGEFGPELGCLVADQIALILVGSIQAARATPPNQRLPIDAHQAHLAQTLIPKLPLSLVEEFNGRIGPELAEAGPSRPAHDRIHAIRQQLNRWTFRRDILQEFALR